jgi:hypothetical protein
MVRVLSARPPLPVPRRTDELARREIRSGVLPRRPGPLLATQLTRDVLFDGSGVAVMTLVNSLCAEISVYQGVGESTGVMVERSAIRGKKGLCKSMRDLAIKSRVLGDGYYYIPVDLWPKSKEPIVVHKHDWTVISSIPRTSRATKKRVSAK